MSILLASVFSIGTVILIQLRTIKTAGDSVVAYYAADSGAETALFQGSLSSPPDIPATFAWSGGMASFETETLATSSPDCDGQWYCIISKGSYQGTQRIIKITR